LEPRRRQSDLIRVRAVFSLDPPNFHRAVAANLAPDADIVVFAQVIEGLGRRVASHGPGASKLELTEALRREEVTATRALSQAAAGAGSGGR